MSDAGSSIRHRLHVACLAIAIVAGASAVGEGVQHLRGNAALRERLASWNLPAGKRERAIAIRDHVRASINHDGLRLSDSRPFFRATAIETLRSGKGFCGEASRVMVRWDCGSSRPA